MYFIGVDIGGTSIKAGIVNNYGKIVSKKECSTRINYGLKFITDDISKLIRDLVTKNNLDIKQIKSIGFGIPGFINKNGLVSCVNLGWKKVNFIEIIKNKFPEIDIYAENDATVAAIAEAKFGSMKNKNIAVMYTLGTGVGSGIIINEKPFTGANGMAAELGHTIIGKNYYNCNCGLNGCLETFCSATAIIKYAQKLIQEGNKSIIIDLCYGNIKNLNAKIVFDAFRESDFVAVETINRFKRYLVKAIASMINTLDPDIISIGGGLSKSSDIILFDIKNLVREHIVYKSESFADIVCANLGSDAGIIGSAFLG